MDKQARETDKIPSGVKKRHNFMPVYKINSYSISTLLKLLREARAERICLEVGSQPLLTLKGQDFEIDGPVVEEAVAEEL